eukprot:TRINITY_DN6035_c0_g1_i9.p1 TRINITY_DN6035_c0_g1~~TRINITY_DN6035_c0_g1_i9.p1  ORF type:complete len:481 (+),score=82.07 TRINITY_DN6035_c0_g1_i9:113-1555(+)
MKSNERQQWQFSLQQTVPTTAACEPLRDVEETTPDGRRGSAAGNEPPVCERAPPSMIVLALVFGLAQGNARDVFLSSAGYYGAEFNRTDFYVWMCGVIYVSPFLIFPAARAFDPPIDAMLGLRKSIPFRLVVPLVAAGAVDVGLGFADAAGVGTMPVLVLGGLLGLLTGAAAHAASQFFGVIHPRLVPMWFLGQCASGIYLNILSFVTGFGPACSGAWVASYYIGGMLCTLVAPVLFWRLSAMKHTRLEQAFQRHEAVAASEFFGAAVDQEDSPVNDGGRDAAWPRFRVIVLVCQWLLISQNISLTSLANVLAHGDFALGQQLVLFKLFGDFAGRFVFAVLPEPRNLQPALAFACVMVVLRLAVWVVFLLHMVTPNGLFSALALNTLWVAWISVGSFLSSWVSCIGISAAPTALKRRMSATLQVTVYCGFVAGVVFGILAIEVFAIGTPLTAADARSSRGVLAWLRNAVLSEGLLPLWLH